MGILALVAVGLSCCLKGTLAAMPGDYATVLSIGDGDTIRVRHTGRAITARQACIDAPETAQSLQSAAPG